MGECVEAYLTAVNAKAMEFNAVRDVRLRLPLCLRWSYPIGCVSVLQDLVAAAALELQGSLDHASPWWTTVDIPNATQDVDTLSTLVGAAIRAVQASIEAEEKAAEEDSSDDGKYSDS